MTKTTIIGLTGPTGSGKSTVAEQWQSLGARIIDTDKLAREVVNPGTKCLAELVQTFSSSILNDDGSLNRKKLGSLAFSSDENTKKLTAITHPYILSLCDNFIEEYTKEGNSFIIIDAPLLFESGLYKKCDFSVTISSNTQARKDRIIQRDQLSDSDAKHRIHQQHTNDYYEKHADIIFQNNKDFDHLIQLSKKFWYMLEHVSSWEELPKIIE